MQMIRLQSKGTNWIWKERKTKHLCCCSKHVFICPLLLSDHSHSWDPNQPPSNIITVMELHEKNSFDWSSCVPLTWGWYLLLLSSFNSFPLSVTTRKERGGRSKEICQCEISYSLPVQPYLSTGYVFSKLSADNRQHRNVCEFMQRHHTTNLVVHEIGSKCLCLREK